MTLEAVAIGGEARPVKRVAIAGPRISDGIAAAVRGFAAEMRVVGEALDDDWLHVASDALPAGWEARVELVFQGSAMRMDELARADVVAVKVLGLCARGMELGDCVTLAPRAEELEAARVWVEAQDGGDPGWVTHVGEMLGELERRLRGVQAG